MIQFWETRRVTQLLSGDGGKNDEVLELMPGGDFFLIFIVFLFFYVVGMMSIAIGWHRHIILNEVPSKFHLLGSKFPLFGYFLMGLQIAIVLLLLWIPVGLILLPFVSSMAMGLEPDSQLATTSGMIFYSTTFILDIIGTWITLRLSLALPAIAVGVDLRMGESFELTRKIRLELLIVAAILVLIQSFPALFNSIVGPFLSSTALLNTYLWSLAQSFVFWLCFMIGVGVLTNAYVHLADKPKN